MRSPFSSWFSFHFRLSLASQLADPRREFCENGVKLWGRLPLPLAGLLQQLKIAKRRLRAKRIRRSHQGSREDPDCKGPIFSDTTQLERCGDVPVIARTCTAAPYHCKAHQRQQPFG